MAVVALRSSEYRNRTAQSREKIFAEKLSILRKNTVLVTVKKRRLLKSGLKVEKVFYVYSFHLC